MTDLATNLQPPTSNTFKTLRRVLTLPWWLAAALTSFLAVRASEFQNVSPMVLGVAALVALTGLAVLKTRGGWLMVTAAVGGAVGFGGWAGMGIQFIDHTPTGLTGTVWTMQNLASIATLISGSVTFVLGIVEIRRSR